MRPRSVGILAALAAAASFAGVNVAARFVLVDGLQPLWLVAFTYAGGGLAMLPFARRARLAPRERPRMALVVAAGAIAAPILLFFGLARTGAADASLLLNLEMGATALLAFLVLGERLRGREALGAGLLALGAIAVSLGSGARGGTTALGALLVAGAACLWAVDNAASAPLARVHDPRGLIALKTLSGGVAVLLAALLLAGPPGGRPRDWLLALAAGLVGVALSSVLFYVALGRVGATRTTVLFATNGLFGVGLAALLLGEPLTWYHAAATALSIAGLLAVGSSEGIRKEVK